MFVDFNILNQLGSPSINSNTFANRPAAGQTGRLFVSTDTFEIYRDNGTGWDLIGGPGSSTVTGSGATGQVTYWTGTNTVSGENALFWDAANNRLGINTATPTVTLDVHSAADIGVQFNGTGATPTILQQFLSAGVSQYTIGYNWNSDINYRRFSIYDDVGLKEVISIDQQSRYVGINFQYSSLTDQPQYMLDLSGGSFHTNTGQFLRGAPTDLTRSFAASGNASDIAVWLEEYGDTTASSDVFFNKGRGTETAKLNVQVGDSLGALSFAGYVNNNLINALNLFATVTNVDTTNNQANADLVLKQSYNSASDTENFRIIANGGNGYLRGSFGIGITTALEKLHVVGGGYITGSLGIGVQPTQKLTIGGTATPQMSLISSTTTGSDEIYFGDATSVFAGLITYNNNGDYFAFYTAQTEKYRVNANGNFLIGTTTDAGQKLQVNGTALINDNITLEKNSANNRLNGRGTVTISALGGTQNFTLSDGSLVLITDVTSGKSGLFFTSYESATTDLLSDPSGIFANTVTALKISLTKTANSSTGTITNNTTNTSFTIFHIGTN